MVVEACDVEADLRGLDVLPLVSPPAAAPDARTATPAAPHQRLRLAVRAATDQMLTLYRQHACLPCRSMQQGACQR